MPFGAVLFVLLMLGSLGHGPVGEMVYRVSLRGIVSSSLIVLAALLITYGERKAFVAGILCWLLALGALTMHTSSVIVIHL